ncbi:FAD/NAD(P)-binding protein [Pseudarthrobacter sp. J1763]|uniref:FAD/NAD(P)-binding protein n=1 Tax=Pseudarthrobacter sp. J1763 TaxID=3420445 RepID=UPI003D275E61
MADREEISVAVVGAGPRGSSVVERLLANFARELQLSPVKNRSRRLRIHVIDPYQAGPGHVWRPDQSRLYVMNTQSFYPTLIPEDPQVAPALTGGSFEQWRAANASQPAQHLTDGERAELQTLKSTDFPSRALYGRYLADTFGAVLAAAQNNEALAERVEVQTHSAEAVKVRRRDQTSAVTPTNGFVVGLSDGTSVSVDRVVLALGHVESRLNSAQQELADAAVKLGLQYFPPAVPADVDWTLIPARQPVLVRGMGLNFFDVMGQLTLGRGGTFRPGKRAGETLEYIPSGQEPILYAASRRGGPYRAKARLDAYYASSVHLRFFTADAVASIQANDAVPGFDHDFWPLLHRDVVWTYYSTLAAHHPDAVTDRDEFLQSLDSALTADAQVDVPGNHWEKVVAELVTRHVAPEHALNLLGLATPFAGQSFANREAFDQAVLKYLDEDALGSAAGEKDPVKMAIGALHRGRALLKTAVADGGITEDSWLAELRGWFESFVEGLASGPPALRLEQLAALVRAGLVHFVGPDPSISVDRAAGLFTASSPWVAGEAVTARTVIEALAPSNRVAVNESVLLKQLLADGLVRPRMMLAGGGTPLEATGLDVVPGPYRAVNALGQEQPDLYVLSLQLSATQWGTAIAAEAFGRDQTGNPVEEYRSGQRTLRDADEVARHILGI